MCMIKLAKRMIKKIKWYDVSLLKLSVFFWTLFLVTAWPGFRTLVFSIAWYWYLILGVMFMLPLLKKVFF